MKKYIVIQAIDLCAVISSLLLVSVLYLLFFSNAVNQLSLLFDQFSFEVGESWASLAGR